MFYTGTQDDLANREDTRDPRVGDVPQHHESLAVLLQTNPRVPQATTLLFLCTRLANQKRGIRVLPRGVYHMLRCTISYDHWMLFDDCLTGVYEECTRNIPL